MDGMEVFIVFLMTGFAVVLAVMTHFECLQLMTAALPRLKVPSRLRLVFLIFGLLTVHLIEIWLFAFNLMFVTDVLHIGHLEGIGLFRLLDYVYYSAVVYTSLGFGDIIPNGPIRFTTSMETLTGLMMLGWSTSFVYIEMQKFWKQPASEHHVVESDEPAIGQERV
jgi:hypothetical protein